MCFPRPGRRRRRSRSPAAQRRSPRTSSQSPLSCASVRLAARARAFSMRSTAVPGYRSRMASASASGERGVAHGGEGADVGANGRARAGIRGGGGEGRGARGGGGGRGARREGHEHGRGREGSARRPGAAETTAEAEGARRRRDAPMGADARAPRDTAVDAAEGAGRERLRRSTSGSARTNRRAWGRAMRIEVRAEGRVVRRGTSRAKTRGHRTCQVLDGISELLSADVQRQCVEFFARRLLAVWVPTTCVFFPPQNALTTRLNLLRSSFVNTTPL